MCASNKNSSHGEIKVTFYYDNNTSLIITVLLLLKNSRIRSGVLCKYCNINVMFPVFA